MRLLLVVAILCMYMYMQGSHYKQGESPLMELEMLLFAVEVIYLWRAFPFCSVPVKQQLLEKLSAPMPESAQPVHRAMGAWLRGGLFSSLNNPVEADKASGRGHKMMTH